MNHAVVVDASVAVKWVIEESHTIEALTQLSEWISHRTPIHAPTLFAFEIVNAVYKRVLIGEVSTEDAGRMVGIVLNLGIRLHQDSAIHGRALEIAYQYGKGATYDAHYLALAEREGCEFWTADERIWNSVKDRLTWVRWIGEVQSESGATS